MEMAGTSRERLKVDGTTDNVRGGRSIVDADADLHKARKSRRCRGGETVYVVFVVDLITSSTRLSTVLFSLAKLRTVGEELYIRRYIPCVDIAFTRNR